MYDLGDEIGESVGFRFDVRVYETFVSTTSAIGDTLSCGCSAKNGLQIRAPEIGSTCAHCGEAVLVKPLRVEITLDEKFANPLLI